MTNRAINARMPRVVKPHREILQRGESFHRAAFRVGVANCANRATAAGIELLLVATDARRMSGLTGKADPGRIIIAAMAEQAGHPSMRGTRVRKARKVHFLRIRRKVRGVLGFRDSRLAMKPDG